jgi:A/G-specific adenine glycosylase
MAGTRLQPAGGQSVDTNVARIQERTGWGFDHTCAQALFDLGREVCLARVPRCGICPLAELCPSRGKRFEPLRKQSRFEGSFRQRRATALRLISECPRAVAELDRPAVHSLARDGLVSIRDGLVALPE